MTNKMAVERVTPINYYDLLKINLHVGAFACHSIKGCLTFLAGSPLFGRSLVTTNTLIQALD